MKEPGKAWGVTNQQDIAWMDTRLFPIPWYTHDQPLEIQYRIREFT